MEGLKFEGKEDEYLPDRLNSMALDFIEQSEDRPFFLYLSHFSVHDPIQGRKDLVEKYRAKFNNLGRLQRGQHLSLRAIQMMRPHYRGSN
ncbi:MAG: hypothetical protein CM1200mP29_14620 [Verrucomicrobiota bacterium]|nr:MAG: hypothetical protein CM1200mP29_14620 [Verrucomicrobiota bacterium]